MPCTDPHQLQENDLGKVHLEVLVGTAAGLLFQRQKSSGISTPVASSPGYVILLHVVPHLPGAAGTVNRQDCVVLLRRVSTGPDNPDSILLCVC